ncbi:MAG: lipase family protein [bacterium]
MSHWHRLLVVGIFVAWLAGCGDDDNVPTASRGTVVRVESMGTFPVALLHQALTYYDAPVSLSPRFSVDAYRVIYITKNARGALVEASGAIFLPAGQTNLPMISLQHPTQTERTAVASVAPLVYGPDAVLAASFGYAACAPDYLGMGESDGMHPYLHAGSAANAVMDLVRAGRRFCAAENVTLNGQLFLGGYSEGAHATMAAQRAMESESPSEFQITAVACLSGPYNLEQMAGSIMADPMEDDVAFIAYFLTAYNDVYGWNRLDGIFAAPYSDRMDLLFDGSLSMGEIKDALPATVGEMVLESFSAGYANGMETEVLAAIRENTLLDWRPLAPVRLYHGTADDLVPFDIAVSTLNSLRSQPGTSVELYPVAGADHEDGILASLDPAFTWFESLRR